MAPPNRKIKQYLYRYDNQRLRRHPIYYGDNIEPVGDGRWADKWDHVNTFYGYKTIKAAMREEIEDLQNAIYKDVKRLRELKKNFNQRYKK